MSERILRKREVLERTGLGNSTLYEEIAAGRFPRQIQLTERSVGWREGEVEAWIASRAVAATGAEACTAKAREVQAKLREQRAAGADPKGASHA